MVVPSNGTAKALTAISKTKSKTAKKEKNSEQTLACLKQTATKPSWGGGGCQTKLPIYEQITKQIILFLAKLWWAS